jgi:hypothetical protein
MKNKIKFALLFLAVVFSSYSYSIKKNRQESSFFFIGSFMKAEQSVDKRLLIGEWTQMDAPYQIKITDALESGKLEVTYFNPKLITIGKAYWTKTETILSVYIELQDENYPSSYYKLNYNIERDVLVGQYFQAAGGAAFPVEFVRTKQ